jgi:hypothetical protein
MEKVKKSGMQGQDSKLRHLAARKRMSQARISFYGNTGKTF